MTTWLHDVDALIELAGSEPGPMRDWANTRLALRAPAEVRHLPRGPWEAELAVTAGAPIDPAELPIGAGGIAGAAGRLPEDPAPWLAALRPRALTGEEPELIELFADLGALDPELLGVVSRTEAGQPFAPGLVLRWAAEHGHPLDPLAAQIAESVARTEPSVAELREMGAVLGLPKIQIVGEDSDEAVRWGSERAGRRIEPPPPGHGSARRRAVRRVEALLDGDPGPAAAWLRAIASLEETPPDWVCGMAGWLAAFEPDPDPVVTVATRAGGEDHRILTAARSAVREEHLPLLLDALELPEGHATPPMVLAAELLGRRVEGARPLASALWSNLDPAWLQIALIGLAADPEPALRWLATTAAGLLFARFLPTEEVLAALLAAPSGPFDAERAWALAELADPAAFAALAALAGEHPGEQRFADAFEHGARLLGH